MLKPITGEDIPFTNKSNNKEYNRYQIKFYNSINI